MALQEIWKRIDTRYADLPPQIQRAARFVREHPEDVALNSLRTLAGKAGVSPTSMTRLMQALAFENWDAFQREHRTWLTGGRRHVFSGRADRLIHDMKRPGAEDELLDVVGQHECANVGAAFGRDARTALREAANLIAEAKGVSIAGLRSCYPVAFGLHYALSLFMPGVSLMGGAGVSLLDEMHRLGPGMVLVTISVDPYSRETVDAARHARSLGARVIGITDRALSPIAQHADVTLVARNESPAHIASPLGPMALSQALALLVLTRSGNGALEAMRRREAMFEATSAYLSEGQ